MSSSITFNYCRVECFPHSDSAPDTAAGHAPGFMDYTDDSCMFRSAAPEPAFFKSVSGLSFETEVVDSTKSPTDMNADLKAHASSPELIAYNGHAGLGLILMADNGGQYY